jgi:hypothetical protein
VTTAAALVTDAAPSKKKRWRGRRGHEKVKVQGLDVMQMTMLQDVRGRW